MAYKDNEHPIVDAVGQKVYKGDRVVFCHRGWDGKEARLLTGTVMRITDCGVWTKPDEPYFGHEFSDKKYDYNTRSFVTTKYYEHNGWKWSHNHLIVKLGS